MVTVIDIENVHLACINQKFGYNPRSGKLFSTQKYKDFKKLLTMSARKGSIEAPYHIDIQFTGNADIDSHIKPILDSLQDAGIIDNDKHVYLLTVHKEKPLHNETALKVCVETIKGAI